MPSTAASDACFQPNLEALRSCEPALAERIAELTGATFREAPTPDLHSRIDPAAQGEFWAGRCRLDTPAVAVMGFGRGWHVSALARRYDGSILVVESSPHQFFRTLREADLRALFRNPKLRWHVGGNADSFRAFLNGSDAFSVRPLFFTPAVLQDPVFYEAAVQILNDVLQKRRREASPALGGGILKLMECLQR